MWPDDYAIPLQGQPDQQGSASAPAHVEQCMAYLQAELAKTADSLARQEELPFVTKRRQIAQLSCEILCYTDALCAEKSKFAAALANLEAGCSGLLWTVVLCMLFSACILCNV
jgi:hypothetical protein